MPISSLGSDSVKTCAICKEHGSGSQAVRFHLSLVEYNISYHASADIKNSLSRHV